MTTPPDAEVLIRPEVDEYDVLDYPMAEELIALGETAAAERLPQIRELLGSPGRLTSERVRRARAVPGSRPARSVSDG